MLELKNIVKKFDNRTIIDNLSLVIPDQEILTIVGPSGAGKTTLLRCLSGLEPVDSGQFFLDGQPFDPYATRDSDSVIGVVFQDFQLFPSLTVRENIALAPKLTKKMTEKAANEKASQLMQELKLSDYQAQYPYQLSGGQKQRVAIARALAMKPRILCYDEPTSALDPDLRVAVQKIILDLKQTEGITQIVITHDLEFANEIADQTLKVKPVK